jgi:virulence factor
MTRQMRVAIIGCGYIAQKAYLPLLSQWPSIEIAWLFSRTEQRLSDIAGRWPRLPKTTQLAPLEKEEIDAAFVLTPAASHFDICHNLIAKGIHVFVEKPPTISSKETLSLFEFAVEKGVVLMVGFNRRFAPLVRQAKTILEDKKINLCLVEKHRPHKQNRNLQEAYLEDLIHQVDLLRFFGGEAVGLKTERELVDGCLLSAISMVGYQKGGFGLVAASREAGRWSERVSIFGDGISVEIQMFREMRVIDDGMETVFGGDRPGNWLSHLEERGFTGEISHFLDCIESSAQPLSGAEDASKTQVLLEQLIQ